MCAGTDGLDSFDANELESEWQQLVIEETQAQQQQQKQQQQQQEEEEEEEEAEKKKENRTEALTQRTLAEQANGQTQMAISEQPAAEHQTARWLAAVNNSNDHDHDDMEQLTALMSSASMMSNMNNNMSSSSAAAAPVGVGVGSWPSVGDLPDPSELSFPDVPAVEPRPQLSEASTTTTTTNDQKPQKANHDKLPLYA